MRLKSVHFADTPNLTNVFTCFMSPFLQMLLRFLKKVLEFSMINEFWTTRTSHPGECEMKLPRIWNEMWIYMEKLKLIKCQDCSNRFSPVNFKILANVSFDCCVFFGTRFPWKIKRYVALVEQAFMLWILALVNLQRAVKF